MSATETALRVIEWALLNPQRRERIPQGGLSATEQLAHPSPALIQSLQQLAAVTAARLSLKMPFLGDNRPLSVGGIIMAAAMGTANLKLARILLKAVSEPSSSGDWVARHGLIAPALPFLADEIADDYRLLSPLTAVFNRPPSGQESPALALVEKLLDNSAASSSLILHLAQPTPDTKVRNWRSDLLARLRLGSATQRKFVLDVYEAMMIYYQQEAMNQVKAAYSVINDREAAKDDNRLQDALSIANWWQPLWAIERTELDALRRRRYLGYTYREGIKLCKLSQKMVG